MKPERREFLKVLAVGTGGAVLGNAFGGLGITGNAPKKEFSHFTIKECGEKLILYNKKEKQIFTLNKDGTFEVG